MDKFEEWENGKSILRCSAYAVLFDLGTSSKNESIENIILKYKDHPGIKSIKNLHSDKTFSMPLVKAGYVKRIFLNLNPKTGPGSDTILPKVVFRSAKLLCKPLTKIINAKLTKVTPIYRNLRWLKIRINKV